MINELLGKLGFTEKESTVYIKLLEQPGLNYNQLSDITKINRTTCYSVVKKLTEVGLVVEDLGGNVVKLFAKNPNTLSQIFQKKQIDSQKKLEIAIRAGEELGNIIPKTISPEPKITYIEEPLIIDYLRSRHNSWVNSLRKYGVVVWGFESTQFEESFSDYIEWYWQQTNTKGLILQLFSDEPGKRKVFEHLQHRKINFHFLPEVDFTTDILVYGDYVVTRSVEHHPFYLLEIYEPQLAKNLRIFFQAMWQVTENLPELRQAG